MALGLRAIRRGCRTDRRGLLLCLSIAIPAAAPATPAAARHKVHRPSPTRADVPPVRCVSDIPRLLDALSARRYPCRQRATERLKEYGPEAYPRLVAAFKASTSLEVRLRLRGIAEHIFLREAAGAREGFLGIQFHVVTQAHDPRLAAGQRGLVVMGVVDNAPADRERAGALCRKWLRDCFSHETAELAVRTVRTDRR